MHSWKAFCRGAAESTYTHRGDRARSECKLEAQYESELEPESSFVHFFVHFVSQRMIKYATFDKFFGNDVNVILR